MHVGVKLRARLRVDGEGETDPSTSPRVKLLKAASTFASKPAIYCRPKVGTPPRAPPPRRRACV
jgi:hypothetical protein